MAIFENVKSDQWRESEYAYGCHHSRLLPHFHDPLSHRLRPFMCGRWHTGQFGDECRAVPGDIEFVGEGEFHEAAEVGLPDDMHASGRAVAEFFEDGEVITGDVDDFVRKRPVRPPVGQARYLDRGRSR